MQTDSPFRQGFIVGIGQAVRNIFFFMACSCDLTFTLKTGHNLCLKLLRKNSSQLDLPCKTADEKQLQLMTLVAGRNEIAHGKKIVISTPEEYEPFGEPAKLLMHELAVEVLERLEKKDLPADLIIFPVHLAQIK